MRRFLLTTAAVLGAAMALTGVANAQEGMPPPPAGNPGPTFGVGGAHPPDAAIMAMAPGMTAPNSFVVHLNGRINWYAGVVSSSAQSVGGGKVDPYGFQGYIRLYPGFNATAANGLKYGVVAEIRAPSGIGTSVIGAGPNGTANTLYWRRAYGYIGTDELGSLRFGQGDGPTTIFQTGTFEGFNDGAWNGDAPGFAPGVTAPVFPFTDTGTLYTTNKVVYLSPDFGGFQFGVGFAPNTNILTNGAGCATAGEGTCFNQSASPLLGGSDRPRNAIEVGGAYTGTFNGLGINVGGAYIGSGHVSAPGLQFNGYSVGNLGATVSFAGFTVGGDLSYGESNFDYALQPRGGRNEFAWMVGAQYGAGPFVVGASYFHTQYSGEWAVDPAVVSRTANDTGIAAGGTYQLVPGMALYLSYLYGQRHQTGWDFNAGAPGPGGNNTHVNVFSLGTVMSW